MDPATLIALIRAGIAGVQGLSEILALVHNGTELTPEQIALVKTEQAAAQARLETSINARLAS